MTKRSIAAISLIPLVLAGCELGPKESRQDGYRGTGMAETSLIGAALDEEVPAPPYDLPADTGGPRASEVYENVQILNDVSADEFNYLMAAITEWVAPEEGCNYCHNPADMASDELYTKQVARQMLAMTRSLNADYSDHVAQTGVTCYTCHRGQNIPEYAWTTASPARSSIVGLHPNGQNQPNAIVGYASLPTDFYERYLAGDTRTARIQNDSMHPTGNTDTIKDAEDTYAMMMHISSSLGVNCVACHNSRSFGEWSASSAKRSVAWHGIQMVRNTNDTYVEPLAPLFPASRLGPNGDPLKVNCSTCHQGNNKPLGGVAMVQDYTALLSGNRSPILLDAAAAEDDDTEGSAASAAVR